MTETPMLIEETKVITSTGSEENANILLKNGWRLLSVTTRSNSEMQWSHFVFGWTSELPPPELLYTGIEPLLDV